MNVWLKDFKVKRNEVEPFLIEDLNVQIGGSGKITNLRELFDSKTLQESTDLKAALIAGEFVQFNDVYDNGNCGLALEIDWTNGTSQKLVADQDCVISFVDLNADQTCHFKLHIEHSTLGKRYFTWPSNVRWKDNIVPFFDGMKGSQVVDFHLFNEYYLGAICEDIYDDPDILFRTISQDRLSGIHNLSWCLDINNQKVFPDFVYLGKDATLADWEPYIYGEVLDIAGSGNEPTINYGSPLLGPLDDSIKYNVGKYHESDNNNFGSIVYEDFIFELVFRFTDFDSTQYLFRKRNSEGIDLFWSSSSYLLAVIDGSIASAQLQTSFLTRNAIYHAMLICDRSGYVQWLINGELSGSAIDISGIGSLEDLVAPLIVGLNSNTNIIQIAMWKKNDWLDTHLQEDLAKERFLQIKGFMPNVAFGDPAPLKMTRDYPAFLDKIEANDKRQLYYMGENWSRFVSRYDKDDGIIKGYLSETAIENECSEPFDLSAWTKIDALDTHVANSNLSPEKLTEADSITLGAGTGQHGFKFAVSLSETELYTISGYIKKKDFDFFKLNLVGVTNGFVFYNINTGELGTEGSGIVNAYVENGEFVNDSYRVCISAIGPITELQLIAAESDSDDQIDSPGSNGFSAWGIQAELFEQATSLVKSGTRIKDVLQHEGIGNIDARKGSISCKVLLEDVDTLNSKYFVYSRKSGTVNYLLIQSNYVNDKPRVMLYLENDLQVNMDGLTSIIDGVIKSIDVEFEVNNVKLLVDGEQDAEDLVCNMSKSFDHINIGCGEAENWQINGVISDIEVKK